MRILFDNGRPNPKARALVGHEVSFARQIGGHELKNGELLSEAEEAGFDLLLRSDKNMRYQQNLTGRRIANLVLGNQQWPDVKLHLERIVDAVNAASPGSYSEVEIPHRD